MHTGQTNPQLPHLESGVTLLETSDRKPLHALVADHLLLEGGTGYWIDARGYASTHPLVDIAPSPRILERIEVARAFTAHQHYSIGKALYDREDLEPGLIVAPAIDHHYRDDSLHRGESEGLLLRTLARLAGLGRRLECPVLVTRTASEGLGEPVGELAARTIRCVSTASGPRFVGEEFETDVYPDGYGWVQTTLAFWQRVLTDRQPLYEQANGVQARV